MDYTTHRRQAIELGGLSLLKMNKQYEMFYDETNNPRLFRITEKGFNIDDKAYFILGGLVFEKGRKPSEKMMNGLYKKLEFQDNIKEIKFKHIKQNAKTFLELLTKSKVRIFIDWIDKNNYWIHYTYRDNFYYSIVDIIDSMKESNYGGLSFSRELKSTLYSVIKKDKGRFLDLLRQHKYPNIKNQKGFIEDIIFWIEEMNFDDDFSLEYMRQSLKSYKKQGLFLLKNNKDFVTIENYSVLYKQMIVLFNESKLTFDDEEYIEENIESSSLEVDGEELMNYKFVDSRENNTTIGCNGGDIKVLDEIFRK